MATNQPFNILPYFDPTGMAQQYFPDLAKLGPAKPEKLGTSTSGSTKSQKTNPEQDIMAQLQAFFDELNAPWDPNDPANQMLLNDIQARSMQSASNRGIFGPYSQNLAEQAMFRAQAPLAMQKKGMAASALGALTGQRNNQRDFNYQQAQDKYANEMDRWKYDQSQNQGLGGFLGGGLGALGGFALGGPAGAAAGYQLGSGIGGQIGGGFGGPPPKFNPGGGY